MSYNMNTQRVISTEYEKSEQWNDDNEGRKQGVISHNNVTIGKPTHNNAKCKHTSILAPKAQFWETLTVFIQVYVFIYNIYVIA